MRWRRGKDAAPPPEDPALDAAASEGRRRYAVWTDLEAERRGWPHATGRQKEVLSHAEVDALVLQVKEVPVVQTPGDDYGPYYDEVGWVWRLVNAAGLVYARGEWYSRDVAIAKAAEARATLHWLVDRYAARARVAAGTDWETVRSDHGQGQEAAEDRAAAT